MKQKMFHQNRHRAREIALQLLYSIDVMKKRDSGETLKNFCFDEEPDEVVQYSSELVRGVIENLREIDNLINRYVTNWRPERMVAVDRAAMRLALYEGVIAKKVPIAVAISEAVEITKVFGTEESRRFVNGALGKIVKALEATEDQTES